MWNLSIIHPVLYIFFRKLWWLLVNREDTRMIDTTVRGIISVWLGISHQTIEGDFLFSRIVTDQVPSALGDLTSVFGMSTGVSLLPSSPYSSLPSLFSNNITGQAFNLLVSVSLRCYHPYTSDLSTSFSSRNLYGNLILRRASYLDAFSSYLFQT